MIRTYSIRSFGTYFVTYDIHHKKSDKVISVEISPIINVKSEVLCHVVEVCCNYFHSHAFKAWNMHFNTLDDAIIYASEVVAELNGK